MGAVCRALEDVVPAVDCEQARVDLRDPDGPLVGGPKGLRDLRRRRHRRGCPCLLESGQRRVTWLPPVVRLAVREISCAASGEEAIAETTLDSPRCHESQSRSSRWQTHNDIGLLRIS